MRFQPTVNIEWTDFHSMCKQLLTEQGVGLKKSPRYEQMLKSDAMRSLIASVSSRLGLEKNISTSEMKLMFRGCAFGHAIHDKSAWCTVFSKQELRLIELLEDVDDFYSDAYGRDINTKAPCSVVRDLVTRIEAVVAPREERTAGSEDQRTFLRFSHAGAIKQLMSYLGLFDELTSGPTTAATTCESETWDSRSRVWRSSLISPFSANLQFILYNCSQAASATQATQGIDYRLRTLLQESPVVVRGCTSDLCPLPHFLAQYRSAQQCNLKKICRI